MPHIFSVEIHAYLSEQIALAEKKKKQAISDNDDSLQCYLEGRLLEFVVIRQYLSENIDLKTQTYY